MTYLPLQSKSLLGRSSARGTPSLSRPGPGDCVRTAAPTTLRARSDRTADRRPGEPGSGGVATDPQVDRAARHRSPVLPPRRGRPPAPAARRRAHHPGGRPDRVLVVLKDAHLAEERTAAGLAALAAGTIVPPVECRCRHASTRPAPTRPRPSHAAPPQAVTAPPPRPHPRSSRDRDLNVDGGPSCTPRRSCTTASAWSSSPRSPDSAHRRAVRPLSALSKERADEPARVVAARTR